MPEKKQKKKTVRNKFRDGIGDYYKTNRTISKESSEETDKKAPMSNREKTMIIMIIVLLIALVIKSTMLDEVKNLSADEQNFKEFVDYSVTEQYDGFLERSGILVYRVYRIGIADKDQKGLLRYEDPNTGKPVELIQDVQYNAKVRGYLLWILPIKHLSVTAEIEK
ncbi:MAG: hypothetical protein K0Q48_1211 [Bacillota bacterium]|nr:hypothetical protein [Bacillota bacterium]